MKMANIVLDNIIFGSKIADLAVDTGHFIQHPTSNNAGKIAWDAINSLVLMEVYNDFVKAWNTVGFLNTIAVCSKLSIIDTTATTLLVPGTVFAAGATWKNEGALSAVKQMTTTAVYVALNIAFPSTPFITVTMKTLMAFYTVYHSLDNTGLMDKLTDYDSSNQPIETPLEYSGNDVPLGGIMPEFEHVEL